MVNSPLYSKGLLDVFSHTAIFDILVNQTSARIRDTCEVIYTDMKTVNRDIVRTISVVVFQMRITMQTIQFAFDIVFILLVVE